jgi:hypothetical protein
MDDDLFTNDELELSERGVDEISSPRLVIASQPIRDGSRALLHDGYDVQTFHDAAGEYPKQAELIATSRERQITAPALICDIFWSFYKHAPDIRPLVPLTPAHQIHTNILEHLMATREWNEVRAAGTIGDVFNSGLGHMTCLVFGKQYFPTSSPPGAVSDTVSRSRGNTAPSLTIVRWYSSIARNRSTPSSDAVVCPRAPSRKECSEIAA